PKVETPVLVGVGAHNADNAIHLGSDMSDPVHMGEHTPGGHAPDGMPRNDHTDSASAGSGGHASDHTPTGGGVTAHPTDTSFPGESGHGFDGGGNSGTGVPGTGATPAEGPNRLAAATDTSVDLDKLGMPAVWRTDDAPLYRSDNRAPEEIFESGFEPLDPSRVDLVEYVEESEHSAFVSTSYRDDIGDDFGGKYTYELDVPGGIDVNTSMGPHPLSYEQEIAFPGGVRPEYIKGARPYNYATGEVGDLIPNPNYRPEVERVP
ncbi:hypothetical protein ABZ934_29410, partial [Streptomyces sp. NPDC046557]|uniref:scabin-related ADP-ribosyltransferase n=1 Tax=Streptomyces sp. NPDC046557 TaxID=3155372 RepID=UPI0033F2F20C